MREQRKTSKDVASSTKMQQRDQMSGSASTRTTTSMGDKLENLQKAGITTVAALKRLKTPKIVTHASESLDKKGNIARITVDQVDSLKQKAGSRGKPSRRMNPFLTGPRMEVVTDVSEGPSLAAERESGNSSVQFSDIVDTIGKGQLTESVTGELFYTEEEIEQFKYEHFMESCGLDPNDADFAD